MSRLYIPSNFRKLTKLLDKQEMAQALELTEDKSCHILAQLLRGYDTRLNPPQRTAEIEKLSLGTLCFRAGVSYQKAVAAYRDFKRSEAVIRAAQQLPAVVEGIAEDATPRMVTCSACEGSGVIEVKSGEGDAATIEEKYCIPCEGRGKIRQAGDAVARKQILEMMELAGKSAQPISVHAAQANVLVTGSGESLEETLRKAREARQGQMPPPTIEGGDRGPI